MTATRHASHPLVVDLPVRGEGWVAVNSPADRIPSHGTDLLGQRYAFDLLITDGRPRGHYHGANRLRTLLLGVPTRECYAWGAAVHAPFGGVVVGAVDGLPERQRVHPVLDGLRAVWTALTFSPTALPRVLGNHVVVQAGDVFGAFVHLVPGSVAVREGQPVQSGDVLGRVGHTGNSTTPHLHFQLMDRQDPMTAQGIPCAFRAYEVLTDGVWRLVTNGIPSAKDRIRSVDPDVGPVGSLASRRRPR